MAKIAVPLDRLGDGLRERALGLKIVRIAPGRNRRRPVNRARKSLHHLRIAELPPRSIGKIQRVPSAANGFGEIHTGSCGVPDEDIIADRAGSRYIGPPAKQAEQDTWDHSGRILIPRAEQFIESRDPDQRRVDRLAIRKQ